MIKKIYVSFIPALILLGITCVACLLSYLVALSFDDVTILRKLMIRLSQAMLFLSIFPIARWLKFNKEMLGFTSFKIMFSQFWRGFGLSFLVLLPAFFTLNALGVHSIDYSKAWTFLWILKKIGVAFGLALVIGLLEESVFRGLLLSGLRKHLSAFSAIWLSSIYYAALHFLDCKSPVLESSPTLQNSFELLGAAYQNMFALQDPTAFLALCAVGLFLGVLRWQGEINLAVCIGCHTGWVTLIRMIKSTSQVHLDSPYAFLVSYYDGIIGLLITGWLILILMGYFFVRFMQTKSTCKKITRCF